MKLLQILLATSTTILATPLGERANLGNALSSEGSVVDRCAAAVNCETYTNDAGKMKTRFKRGMEPGTPEYERLTALAKRDGDGSSTAITISDETIWWGCDVDPVATLGNVGDICQTSGNCLESKQWSSTVNYATPDGTWVEAEPFTLSAKGHYPPWLRNGIVMALQAVMGVDGMIDMQTAQYAVQTGPTTHVTGPQTESKSCQVAKAPQEIDMVYFSAPNVMEATITVIASIMTPDNGFCASVGADSGLASSISGAFGAAGASIGAIFGSISAACAIADGS